jgi:signal transduction histidine kinase
MSLAEQIVERMEQDTTDGVDDVTGRRRVEEALRQRNRELALLNRASQALVSTLDPNQVLVAVLEEVRRLLNVVASSVWLVDPETEGLVCRHATGSRSELVRDWHLVSGQGFAGWVARSGESLIVPDTWTDERHFQDVDQVTGLALRSILAVPLRVKEDVIGVLEVVDTEINSFGTTDLTLLESLAASAAIAIDNARLVEALRQRTSELEARNQDLDAFAHTVAHDLKSPLSHIIGFAEMLEEIRAKMSDEELDRYLHEMVQSGRKMSNIINSLLLLAGVRQIEAEVTLLDMASVVAEAQQRLAFLIEKQRAKVVLPETWPAALGYGPWVEEVWVNYLSNALQYGGRPPCLELGASPPSIPPAGGEVLPSIPPTGGEVKGGMVRFWVRDNGAGISPEEQARLFTPFTRLDQVSTKGHGLGLSIVRRIVEKLGGQVGVESEVGRGSVFSFTLPAVDA